MPKTRLKVALEVRQAFNDAEQAAEQSAAALARCVAVLVEARREAKLSPLAGAAIMALVSKGSQSAMDACQQMLAAHPLLSDMGRELKVIGYGPDGGCVPNEPFTGASGTLRVVGVGT